MEKDGRGQNMKDKRRDNIFALKEWRKDKGNSKKNKTECAKDIGVTIKTLKSLSEEIESSKKG